MNLIDPNSLTGRGAQQNTNKQMVRLVFYDDKFLYYKTVSTRNRKDFQKTLFFYWYSLTWLIR